MADFSVVIVGGGIHGAGLLHDLTSRRVPGVLLCESNELAQGTSSRSTKLIHGGLRYLERFEQWPLVREALQERTLLTKILPEVVKPLPFILPNTPSSRPPWMVRLGLGVYDVMSGDSGMPRATYLKKADLGLKAPYLNSQYVDKNIHSAFLFYDAQTIDDALVRLAAYAGVSMGGTVWERAHVEQVRPRESGGYEVTVVTPDGTTTVTSQVVVNASAAHANANLLKWGMRPQVATLLNVGSHILFPQSAFPHCQGGEPAACLLQNTDGRILFFIPWEDMWLWGTTESICNTADPSSLETPPEDLHYLEQAAQGILDITSPLSHMGETFAGVRTMPLAHLPKECSGPWDEGWAHKPYGSPFYVRSHGGSISRLSRETRITTDGPGFYSLYGGKYTTYRYQSLKLGGMVCHFLDIGGVSQTHLRSSWHLEETLKKYPGVLEGRKHLRHSPRHFVHKDPALAS